MFSSVLHINLNLFQIAIYILFILIPNRFYPSPLVPPLMTNSIRRKIVLIAYLCSSRSELKGICRTFSRKKNMAHIGPGLRLDDSYYCEPPYEGRTVSDRSTAVYNRYSGPERGKGTCFVHHIVFDYFGYLIC